MNILLELTKFRISLAVTLSAAAGFILAKHRVSAEILMPMVGILLLACGSCGLNQYQEREIDALMERTKGRPLPSRRLKPAAALWIASILIFSGSLILFRETGTATLSLGLFAVLWYNGVYTYLKRMTAFAAIPGALIGAVPPVIGWASGGGRLLDPQISILAFFFFIWQVAHFWLLLLDSAKDYEKAGLPSLTRIFSTGQLRRIVFVWILSTGVSSLLIPLFVFLNFYFLYLLLAGATLWLVWNATSFLASRLDGLMLRPTFTRLNVYAFFVLSILSFDRLLKMSSAEYPLIGRMLAFIGLKPA